MEVENKYFTLKQYVDGFPSESDFELRSGPLLLAPQEGSKKVIVKNLFVSVDPYQINRMKKRSPSHKSANFAQRIDLGKRIDAMGVGRVVAACGYAEEELLGWEDYTVAGPGSMLTKIPTSQFPLSYHVSVLGSSGLTAYAGFYQICKPRRGETVFVSAACGSVGHLVGQFAKLSGCYVVGCAGSKKKVDLLKGELGFDDAFNYKEERDINSALKRCFPSGIDIYFDNVGGEMLEAAVANMNAFGRVAVCGAISEYTSSERRAAPDMLDVIYKRITVQGFLAYDHIAVHDEFISVTSDYLRHGRMQSIEDISHGLESIPSAFIALFRGDNVGKKLVQL
ncbi:NADP-dependent alkenal double bond reductase P2-like [Ananas comosus]|uniref:NADP-dependent alkenal double bond reductase P2-like n=1 Tax=Ananas comosus TaxID=4615 RepID=A0A6P5EXR6_ANACO|nr:NADP-dependent alkenal double bond reductase P2-like [Ananas comosus]